MEMIDRSGEPRRLSELLDAKNAITKELIGRTDIVPRVWVHYPTIISALDELIARRSDNEN